MPSTDNILLEYGKNLSEYLKHLTTLATGSIVLQIAFLEKVFPHPKWKAFMVVSLLAFTLSIIASVVGYTLIVLESQHADTSEIFGKGWMGDVGTAAILGTWLGFLLGILSLVIFALGNLFTL